MKTHKLSEDLSAAIEASNAKNIRLGEIVDATGDKSFGLILLILALPSALPIPATGVSTPLGIAMFFVGVQMIWGRKSLWLPKFVRRLRVPMKTARQMMKGLFKVLGFFENFVRPRFLWIHGRAGHIYYGLLVALLSTVMQAPIPLTNTLPAATIFLMALALTEDDGLLGGLASIVGILVALAYIVGFGAILFFGFQSLDQVMNHWF